MFLFLARFTIVCYCILHIKVWRKSLFILFELAPAFSIYLYFLHFKALGVFVSWFSSFYPSNLRFWHLLYCIVIDFIFRMIASSSCNSSNDFDKFFVRFYTQVGICVFRMVDFYVCYNLKRIFVNFLQHLMINTKTCSNTFANSTISSKI